MVSEAAAGVSGLTLMPCSERHIRMVERFGVLDGAFAAVCTDGSAGAAAWLAWAPAGGSGPCQDV
eukprot:12799825-Alexandrium_andersonii.AAC.1